MGTENKSASALSKDEEEGKQATVESAPAKEETTEKDNDAGAVQEVVDDAETQATIVDQVKGKILEVAAPVSAAATAATAAVAGFINSGDGNELQRETSPIPGTFPATPQLEKSEDATMVDEVKKTDDEPAPGVVVPSQSADDADGFAAALAADKAANTAPTDVPLTEHRATDAVHILPIPSATAPEGTLPLAESTAKAKEAAVAGGAAGFAAALEADKAANTPPTHVETSSKTERAPDTVNILPVPSTTAPEGTLPLAESTTKPATAEVGSLAPEPTAQKEVTTVPESNSFQPVTSEANIISSAGESKTEQLKAAALQSSEHAAQTAAKALAEDAPTPPTLDAKETLAGLTSGAGVTAIGTATDNESEDTGLSRLVARKEDEKVKVDADAKTAHLEPAIVLDDTKLSSPTVETLGISGNAAVASTPITVTVPTPDGVKEVQALGTAIVTDGGKESETLKTELLNNGKTTLPEGALAHLSEPSTEKASTTAPPTPAKDSAPPTPSKTPVSKSSVKDKRASGVPSEHGSEKKKGGFLKRLKRVFS